MTTPNWLNPVPAGDVGHGQLPGDPQQWGVLSEDQLQQMRKQLLESVVASVVQAVRGLFVPGPFGSAIEQLEQWASGVQQQIAENLAEAQQNWQQFTEELGNFLQIEEWEQFWQSFITGDFAAIQQQINENLAEAQQNWQQFTEELGNFLQVEEWEQFWQSFITGDFAAIQQQINENLAEAQQNWQQFTEELSNFLQIDKWQEFLSGDWSDVQQQIADNLAEAQQNWQQFTEELSNFLQLDKWQEFLDGAWADLQQTIADILDDLVNFLKLDEWQAYLDNLWLNLTGVKPDTTITVNDATDQFALLMATTAAQATTIAQLQAAINKPPNGVVGGDDFERPDAASLGTGWKIYEDNNNGEFNVVNGQAAWKREGILANTIRCIRIDPKDAKTNTPYQTVTRVTGTTVLQTIALGESAEDIVYARVSDDHKAYMLAWWDIGVNGKGRLHLAYNLGSGGDKEVQVVPCDKPSPGVPLTLTCGDATSLYSYRVIRGNTALIEWDDPNRLTTPLVNNRGWGFGGRAQFGAFGQFGPSSAHSVTVADTRDL